MPPPIYDDDEHTRYGQERRRRKALERKPMLGNFEIKVFGDTQTLSTGNGKFAFVIPEDLDESSLIDAQAYVTTVSSSGAPTVQIRNGTTTNDMLSTRITIDASEKTSYTAATPSEIDPDESEVSVGDEINIDVDVAGTGAKGLGVILVFG